MYCNNCGCENSKDSLFCKKCGYSLVESYLKHNDEVKDKKYKSDKVKNISKNYNKQKVINKKIVKNNPKKKDKKNKESDNVKYIERTTVVRKMTFFQKFMFFLLILFILVLISVVSILGLYIFSKKTVEVPYVVGMNYEDALRELQSKNFSVSKKEVPGDENIVLKQSKKSGTYVINGSNIVLSVGVEERYLPNLLNMSDSAAVSILNEYGIQYAIEYVENNKDVVIYQSYKEGAKISKIKKIKLKVGKIAEKEEKNDKEKEDIKEEETDSIDN